MAFDCIFCKIINNEISSYKIYEDEDFVVIFDRFPCVLGHALILPKKHFENIFSVDDYILSKSLLLAKKISIKIKEILKCDGINILQNNGVSAGQSVEHFHIHIIPRFDDDNVILKWENCELMDSDFEKLLNQFNENKKG